MVSFTLLKSVNGHCMCFVLSKFNSLYQFRKLHWPFDTKAAKNQLLRLFFLHSAYISLPMEGSKFHSKKSVLCLFSSRAQSLLASNWHISSNIQWPDILVSWFRIVAYSTAINPNFLIHFRIYSTQHAFSSGEERSRKEIKNWEAFIWSNKWKIIKNFVAIAYFQLFKTAHFLLKGTILQFFPHLPWSQLQWKQLQISLLTQTSHRCFQVGIKASHKNKAQLNPLLNKLSLRCKTEHVTCPSTKAETRTRGVLYW